MKPPDEVPRRIQPMLAQSAAEAFDSEQHLFEVKWDGTRCIAYIEPGKVRLENRRFIEMYPRYPEFSGLGKLPAGTILDGEIVVLDNGKPSFSKLQRREHLLDPNRIDMVRQRLPATFIVFDLLYLKGRGMMNCHLLERRQALKPLIEKLNDPHLIVSDYITGLGRKYFEGIEKLGFEGMMAKRLDSVYRSGKRSKDWLKIKVAQTASYAILGFVPIEGTEKMGALIIGEQRGRTWVYKGKVGTGFSDRERQEFYKHLIMGASLPKPPRDGPEDAIWRSTGMQCKVRFLEKTGTGKLRAPVFVGMTG